MKIKSSLLLALTLTAAFALVNPSAQARQSGMLPEDNSSSVVDDKGGLNGNTNSASNSGGNSNSSKKNSGNNKVVEKNIKLIAAPEFAGAKGAARSRISTKKQDFKVEIQVSKKLVGNVYGVTVGDAVVGTVTINAVGKGKLELSTENGDVVPAIAAGTLVGVLTETGGIVFAGQF